MFGKQGIKDVSMRNQRFMLYLLGNFIAAIILLLFLQYNSSRNIDQLIAGNESLLGEYQLKSDIQNLLIDLSYVSQANEKVFFESKGVDFNEMEARRKRILEELQNLRKLPVHDSTKRYLEELERLVNRLLAVIDKDVTTLYDNDAHTQPNRNRDLKKKLDLQIITVTTQLSNTRDAHLASLVAEADRNGQEAKYWGGVLAVVSIIASLFALWYIINKVKLQQRLIGQLNESEQKVRSSALIKENFMANMSHEIRTPMNAILGFTHLLQKQPLNEKSREFVSSIQNSGESLLTIINDVLDFSKIEAGMMRIESNPFILRDLLQSVNTMFLTRAQVKGLSLQLQVEASIPDTLNGDAVRLTQIMVNLVNNAVKFTQAGGVEIKVSPAKQTEDTLWLEFSVKDTGIGIPPEKLDTIFERFQQADEDTTRKYGGTGLGLAIVKQLVELQGGSIRVAGEQNKGSEFLVTLPYTIAKDTAYMNKPEFITPDEIPPGKNVAILVAEDNAMNQNLMKHLLTNWNLDFDLVNNGEEAVEALGQKKYDLVLMDIQMPGMDGFRATQKIRNELNTNIPIVAMTAHALAGEREKCLGYGMNEYISKPIREYELLKMINNMLGRDNGETASKGAGGAARNGLYKTIDMQYLEELSGGNKDFQTGMVEQFLEQVPGELADLENAFNNKDFAAVAKIAHNMKTSVSFLGLLGKLGDILDDIEAHAITHQQDALLTEKMAAVGFLCNEAFREAGMYLDSVVGNSESGIRSRESGVPTPFWRL